MPEYPYRFGHYRDDRHKVSTGVTEQLHKTLQRLAYSSDAVYEILICSLAIRTSEVFLRPDPSEEDPARNGRR
ncbi:hypothetical protein F2P79_004560 [Pimephales promelas]|nr:hypothetical protein F2P79_004560 [Pimephales promelas]